MNYKFLYAGPDGHIRENNFILPKEVLLHLDGHKEGLLFRFCWDKENNKIFIQDESFRDMLNSGDKEAWNVLNHCLRHLSLNGARFVEQAFGDPVDSGIYRKMSDYAKSWKDITKFLKREFDIEPIDIDIYEYVPLPENESETVRFLPKGATIGEKTLEKLTIGVNRYLHKPIGCQCKDVNYELIGVMLSAFYLDHIKEIAASSDSNSFKEALDKLDDPKLMLALNDNEKTRIFRPKANEGRDESKIRNDLKYDGPIIFFSFDKSSGVLCIKNHLLGYLYENPVTKKMLEDILSSASKISGFPKHRIALTCDPSTNSGFKSKLNRYKIPWTLLPEPKTDMDVIEVRLNIDWQFPSKIIKDEKEEDSIEGLKNYRAARGMTVSYPLMVVNGDQGMGKKLRSILDNVLEFSNGKSSPHDSAKLIIRLKDTEVRSRVETDMKFLMLMGLAHNDVLDFFAGRDELAKRMEFSMIFDSVLAESGHTHTRTIKASMGRGLQINDWFGASQEILNQAQHEQASTKPFNLKKKKQPVIIRGYEDMLRMTHDKESSAQKTIEQLLRESQI